MSDEDQKKPASEGTPAAEGAAEQPAAAEAKPATEAAEKAPAKKAAKKPAEGEAKKPEGEAAAEGEGAEGEEPKKKEETAADLLSNEIGAVKIRKAKGSKNVTAGICYILATFNNTKVTFTDMAGNALSWSSAGKCNFRGSRKATAYAAQVVTQDAGRVAMSHGLRDVEARVKGPGMGRDSAIRALQALGLNVTSIVDVTPVPHNGCRSPKRRRV